MAIRWTSPTGSVYRIGHVEARKLHTMWSKKEPEQIAEEIGLQIDFVRYILNRVEQEKIAKRGKE